MKDIQLKISPILTIDIIEDLVKLSKEELEKRIPDDSWFKIPKSCLVFLGENINFVVWTGKDGLIEYLEDHRKTKEWEEDETADTSSRG